MKYLIDLNTRIAHLELRYQKLIERSNNYKYVDECKSDIACYKALKILKKLNRIKYLDNSLR